MIAPWQEPAHLELSTKQNPCDRLVDPQLKRAKGPAKLCQPDTTVAGVIEKVLRIVSVHPAVAEDREKPDPQEP